MEETITRFQLFGVLWGKDGLQPIKMICKRQRRIKVVVFKDGRIKRVF